MSTDEARLPRVGRQVGPLPRPAAWRGLGRSIVESVRMLSAGSVAWPRVNVGRRIRFADGSTGRVYRETAVTGPSLEPCLLVVTFRLRLVRGPGHVLFRWESWLNTPLFVGFPGFRSKLWVAHDEHGRYRGVYEWDGAPSAEHYARSLWRVLELVSEPGSIDFMLAPGLRRDDVLAEPRRLAGVASAAWWRPVGVA